VLGYDDGPAVEEREIKGGYEILRDGIRISGDMDVVVYSIEGKEVKRYRVEGESFIKLSDLPKGVYMVKIGREVVKFVRM
jgi:hypothetical protein